MEVLVDSAIATLASIADRMFPADEECPGGVEIGVVPFILAQLAGPWGQGDRMYQHPPFVPPPHQGHGWQSDMTPAEAFRYGLAALDEHAARVHGASFASLTAAAQDELLADVERGAISSFERLDPALFFDLLLGACVEGVFSDPRYGGNRNGQAWAWIGFPGPGPHADNDAGAAEPPEDPASESSAARKVGRQ